jgi:ribosomal protein S18 acetylase RimI-like enzyme
VSTFWGDLSVGIGAALILSLLTTMVALGRDILIRRRYPVAGLYASEYEDRVQGQLIKVKAVSRFKQRGRKIWGTAENISDSRKWELEGHIGRGGRLYGTYESSDPHDEGLGGFFLELQNSGRLEGMWTGFDSLNKSVESGRYSFWPLEQTVVRPMTKEDIPEALALLGEALGHRYVTSESLHRFARKQEATCAYVAQTAGGLIVGAATGMVVDPKKLETAVPTGSGEAVRRLVPEVEYHRVGVLKSVAVSPSAQSRGVGTALAREVTKHLWSDHATCALSFGWYDEDGCHIQGVVESLGFHKQGELSEFWHQDSIEHNYECPSCGSPCVCTAVTFLAKSSESREHPNQGSASQSSIHAER